MTTQQDVQIGIKKETTYGTAAVVDTFFEFTEEDLAANLEFAQGQGMRYGKRVARADRRRLQAAKPGGSFTTEVVTKGIGKLVEAAFGVGTSTAVPTQTGAYQQLFTLTATDPLPSYTIQEGIPPLGGGAAQPQTFKGMVCSGFDLTLNNLGLVTIKWNWVGQDVDTSTVLASASYATGVDIFTFVDAAITVGGTVTVPTATALATGGTQVATIRDLNLTLDNGLDQNGYNIGAGGKRGRKPALGLRAIAGTLTAEYSDNTLRDAYMNQSDIALVLTLKRADITIGTSANPAFQIVIPLIRLEGELPKANGGDVVTQSVGFTALDGGVAASQAYVAIVTTETAI
ncbi:phage tail tube protein [Galbitalea sp. SE-J8]|uniref:phage tail tube protein n=1 Tax=Galbitalea sp. SE-J8 TaxID=3054952 RepID=UPI00259CBFEA|nr:phage tail tube protein [Galbitalea sp. SE-J8]MDM4761884.1 phage tail tube protein [Galbitalea sp. SE-J8]